MREGRQRGSNLATIYFQEDYFPGLTQIGIFFLILNIIFQQKVALHMHSLKSPCVPKGTILVNQKDSEHFSTEKKM